MPIGLTGNDFFPLRAQTLYDPAQLNAQAQNAPPIPPIPAPDDIAARLSQLYQPQTQMSDMYKQALMQIPQPEKPSMFRNIAAALAGLGSGAGPADYWGGNAVGFKGNPKAALETTDLVRNAPYYKAMEQYGVKTKALGAGATQEEKENTERARTAETTLLREQQFGKLKLDQEKSDQIYEVKLSKLQQDLEIANQKADFAQQKLAADNSNKDARLEFNKAQLDALNARHQLDIAQKDRALAEQKRLHDTMKEKWDAEAKDREARIAQYEQQLGINRDKLNKPAGAKSSQDKTVTVETKDATGKVTGTRTTTTKSGIQEPKKEEERVVVYDLKTGKNIATIPKSNVEKLDKTKYGVR